MPGILLPAALIFFAFGNSFSAEKNRYSKYKFSTCADPSQKQFILELMNYLEKIGFTKERPEPALLDRGRCSCSDVMTVCIGYSNRMGKSTLKQIEGAVRLIFPDHLIKSFKSYDHDFFWIGVNE